MAVPQQTTIQQAVGQPMAQEIPPVAPQAQPLATTGPMDPQSAIKALTGEGYSIDFDTTDILDRITAFQNWTGRGKFNTPLMETFLSCVAPKGVSMVLMAVVPDEDDCWHGKDAVKIMGKDKADEGYVLPTAAFINKIGQIMGVKLVKQPSGINNDTGRTQYEELYNAYVLLPNGELKYSEREGKAQDVANNDGSPKAQLKENTREKAQRNAYKDVLDIPTSMKKEKFMRPWVLCKVTLKPGQSDECDAIIAFQKRLAEESLQMLYGKPPLQIEAKGPALDDLIKATNEATTLDALRVVRDRGKAAGLSQDQYIIFKHAVETRLSELQGGDPNASQS